MSYDMFEEPHALTGVHRSIGRRSTRSNRPYSRQPSASTPGTPMMSGNGRVSAHTTPVRNDSTNTTPARERFSRPNVQRSVSIVSGLKNMLSSWITPGRQPATSATPASAAVASPSTLTKRGKGSRSGSDSDDPSPSRLRASKRARRASPQLKKSASRYDPETANLSEFAGLPSLPTLPVSLSSRRQTLPASVSMPYLDPPSSLLAPTSPARPRRSARARAGASHIDEDDLPAYAGTPKAAKLADTWSPWRENKAPTPATVAAARRQSMLPSTSPFRSSSVSRSALGRSSTVNNLARAASVAPSEASSFGRRASGLRHSTTMEFGSLAHDQDEDMGVPQQQQWTTPRQRTSLAPSPSVSHLLSRTAPTTAPQPSRIRKGQMVWDADKGFVRESDLAAERLKPVHKNDAERILAALETMRKPQPMTATDFSGLPSDLVGSSSRTLRKAIAVPLAAAQADAKRTNKRAAEWLGIGDGAGISAVISPYGRRRVVEKTAQEERRERGERERSRLAESDVSDMDDVPSPRMRSHTRSRSAASDVSDVSAASGTSRGSRASPAAVLSPTRRSARLSAKSPEPNASTPVRRSTRRRAGTASPEPSSGPATRSRRKEKEASPIPEELEKTWPEPRAAAVPVLTTTAPSPVSKDTYQVRDDTDAPRARSSFRAGPERKNRQHQGAASYTSSRATTPGANGGSSGRFSARDEDLPDMDDLEAVKLPPMSFKSFTFGSSASTPPPAGFSFETNKEKEADNDNDTEADGDATPTLASRLSAPAPVPAPQAASLSVPASSNSRSSLGRSGPGISTRPRASSPLAGNSWLPEPDSPQKKLGLDAPAPASVAPKSPPTGGFFPIAATPSLAPSGGTTPAPKPVASSFFAPPAASAPASASASTASAASTPGSEAPKFFQNVETPTFVPPKPMALNFGSTPVPEIGRAEAPKLASGPFSFGASPASSGAATPTEAPKAASTGFSFGAPAAKPAEAPKPAAGGFSFGAPATKPVEDKAAAPAAGGFSFGAPAAKPAEAPKPAASGFSFGAPAASADKPAEAPKPASTGFSFGAPASTPAAAADKPKPAFSFGTPSAPASPAAEVPKPASLGFSFGAPAADQPAQAPKPAAAGFSFGSPAPAAAAAPKAGGFSFGTPSSTPAKPADKPAPGFSFGASTSTTPAATPAKPAFGFGASANGAIASGFGTGTSTPAGSPAPAAGGFTFGKPVEKDAPAASGFGSAPSGSGFGGFGAKPAESTPAFGSSTTASTGFGAPAASAGFGFGSSSTPAAPAFGSTPAAPATGFGSSGFGSSAPAMGFGSSTSTGFGAPAPAPASGGFGFGNGSNPASPAPFGAPTTPSAPTAGGFTFGAPAASTSAAPAAGGFTFGATTPAGSAPASPSLAPASSPAPFGFGAPAASSSGGGFSLGSSDGAPGSPGGRKIKPLRRGAVKR